MIRLKKSARKLSLRKRFLALSSNEAVQLRFYEKQLLRLMLRLRNHRLSKDAKVKGIAIASLLLNEMINIATEPAVTLEPLVDYRRTIDSFTASECWNYFETRKEDLKRLLLNLRFPDKCTLENGSKMPGEEVLLRGLYELVSGADQHEITVIFGRQSRAFKYFVDHIYDNFVHLVTDNISWWYNNGYMHQSRDAIRNKFGGNEYFSTFAFIDCNCLDTSRPGGGPAGEGTDAARWHPLIQRAFYNGWKSVHGLKNQTVDTAFGMTMDIYGPYSLRKNDLKLLTYSRINARLREIQEGRPDQLTLYGDSIYPRLSHLHSSWRNAPPGWKRDENIGYTKVRISIEWNYAVTGNLFGYLCNHNKLKLLGSSIVSKIYTVATLLRNCHVALYGCETSNYFNVLIPPNFLEMYLNQL